MDGQTLIDKQTNIYIHKQMDKRTDTYICMSLQCIKTPTKYMDLFRWMEGRTIKHYLLLCRYWTYCYQVSGTVCFISVVEFCMTNAYSKIHQFGDLVKLSINTLD